MLPVHVTNLPECFFEKIVGRTGGNIVLVGRERWSMNDDIFVEQQKDGSYKATQKGRTIASGDTQGETIDRAERKQPNATILVERVRNTKTGGRDKWRKR
jgi:hypothetical protein